MTSLLYPYVQSLRRLYYLHVARRLPGTRAELAFWNKWFRTHGLTWQEDYARRLNPLQPLVPHLRPFVDAVPSESVTILDVGAGPLTIIGYTHPTKQLQITATDILAPHYDKLLARYQIIPPVRTIIADAEQLDQQFPLAAFDLVHAQNCLDHTRQPLHALQAMLAVTKPGGWVILSHQENEAEQQQYRDLHQWNLTSAAGDFVIWNKQQRLNISELLSSSAQITCQLEHGWLMVHIAKQLLH